MHTSRGAGWCSLLSLIGIALAGYLVFVHLGLLRGELLGGAACGGSGAFNCHAVTGSIWGSFLGMPLALWGIFGYIAVLGLSLLARQSSEWAQHALTLIGTLGSLFLAVDLGLLALMTVVIQRFCLLCLATYVVNLLLTVVVVFSLGRSWPAVMRAAPRALAMLAPSPRRPVVSLFWALLLVGFGGAVAVQGASRFAIHGAGSSMRTQLRQFVATQSRVRVAVEGDPMLGPPDAPLVLIEFSDFFCPTCQRASKLTPVILASHRRDAALLFKHFPLDTSCNDRIGRMVHPHACEVAAAAECAHRQGKFWPFHDLVFEEGPNYNVAHLEADARRAGVDVERFRACLASGEGLEAVKRDIAEGGAIGVNSTPTYVINGLTFVGGISPATFEELVAVLREGSR